MKTMIGEKFGRLEVLGFSHRVKWHDFMLCNCDCGKQHIARRLSLLGGTTRSCGCLGREVTASRSRTHGMSKTKTYKTWDGMHYRCNNQGSHNYANYGGRGIRVCERWDKFDNFLADMGESPEGMTIDRIDNDGNYEPSNCRWATIKDQNRNHSRNVMISFDGQDRCISEWAEIVGLNWGTLSDRINGGWTIEKALCTPARKKRMRIC